MKVGILLVPQSNGKWLWNVGRAGAPIASGEASSYEKAQREAEAAAKARAEKVARAQSYVYDTETGERVDT